MDEDEILDEAASTTRHRDEELDASVEPTAKRVKLEASKDSEVDNKEEVKNVPQEKYILEDLLPPSRSLLPSSKLLQRPTNLVNLTFEADVGITEYVGADIPPFQGIIKQRFTDFLVFEIDKEGNVTHLQSIEKPEALATTKSSEATTVLETRPVEESVAEGVEGGGSLGAPITEAGLNPEVAIPEPALASDPLEIPAVPGTPASPSTQHEPWPEAFNKRLASFLSPSAIDQLREMYLQGPIPPLVSDGGWSGRKRGLADGDPVDEPSGSPTPIAVPSSLPQSSQNKKNERSTRGGRGGRGGSRGGRGGRPDPPTRPPKEDPRKVVSHSMADKATRTGLHQAIRELFGGKLESEVEHSQGDDSGTHIAIKWNHRASRNPRSNKPGRNPRDPRDPSKPYYPPYIHFTLQKANRDTQDCLAHISRMLKCSIKDLGVAGTKDKRGVTTQRVSLKRGHRKLEDVWRAINGVPARRSAADVITVRGERGVRIGDLVYRKAPLELGHLKGNSFLITLRNVKSESEDILNRAMQVLKDNGFINYYGMQRFGTSSVPTHSIGLALLKSEWRRALSLILRPRPGDSEEADEARRAWLDDRNLEKALQLMPRRLVAERCVLEQFKKNFNSDSDMQGALHAIPKNLRTMYIHAYQSYVWNAIVSERLARFGFQPVPGDLVFDRGSLGKYKIEVPSAATTEILTSSEAPVAEISSDNILEGMADVEMTNPEESEPSVEDSGKKNITVKVHILTESDMHEYSIFDVIMPLPGFDVSYPGGELGEKYRAFMKLDGIDPDNMLRERKDYSLSGSYRKIMHLPKHVSWSILHYNDPEDPLAQSDEDKFLGFEPPAPMPGGKYTALQIELQLSSAVYATMALREVTKTETSAHHQASLTQASEDSERLGDEKA